MNKKLLIGAIALIVSTSTFAGGLLTNTNQNATFLRNPARDAVIAIDGVYSNPAGIAFLPQGAHFSVSWQAAWQKREITSTFPLYAANEATPGLTKKDFVGKAKAPVIPSFQFAYVFNDKWSVSAQFAIGGGGGKCEFNNGLATFEKLMAETILGTGQQSYGLNQTFTGEQYVYGLQVGGTYKITDKISVFGGIRGVLANYGYEGALTNISAGGMKSADFANLAAQANAAAEQLAQIDPAQAAIYAQQAVAAMRAAGMTSDYILDCTQDGFGITPIIGIDVNLGKLNLAAKYEFRTKLEMESEAKNSATVIALAAQQSAFAGYLDGAKTRSDIPALLTIGAQYSILPSLRVNGGYHLYFDKDAKGSATAVSDNTWESSLGAEWDINDKWLVSFGVQRTQYGFGDEDMSDMNFNIRNTSLGIGGAYQINDMLKLNVGYYHTFYEDHEVVTDKGNGISATDLYTRKNDVVGVSLDFKF